jgi:hypothetical protein
MSNTREFWERKDLEQYIWNPAQISSLDSYENRIGETHEGEYSILTYSPLADDLLGESNYKSILFYLQKSFPEYSEYIKEVRTGHWTYAYFDSIHIPMNAPDDLLSELAYIMNALSDYPLFDDKDYSTRQWELAEETWESMSIKDRVELLQENNICIFAARRDEMPNEYDLYGNVFEQLVGGTW